MTRNVKIAVAIGAALALLLGLVVFAVARGGSGLRGYLGDNYRQVSRSGDSAEYLAAGVGAAAVASAIASRYRPVQRYTSGNDTYLRYDDDIVAIRNAGNDARISIDDEDRGYARWAPIVGGVWAPPSRFGGGGGSGGTGGSGGGPGDGK